MVRVDVAGAAKGDAGGVGLEAGNHGVDALAALAAHPRIAIDAVVAPGLGNEGAARRGIGFIPDLEIAFDENIDVR